MTVRAEVLSVERGVATVRMTDGAEEHVAAFEAGPPAEEPARLREAVARWWYAHVVRRRRRDSDVARFRAEVE